MTVPSSPMRRQWRLGTSAYQMVRSSAAQSPSGALPGARRASAGRDDLSARRSRIPDRLFRAERFQSGLQALGRADAASARIIRAHLAACGACTREAILGALQRRRFYASQGPAIERLAVVDNWLSVETSPIRCARLVGPRHQGQWIHQNHDFRRVQFRLPSDWAFIRLEIEDADRKIAWTNALGVA